MGLGSPSSPRSAEDSVRRVASGRRSGAMNRSAFIGHSSLTVQDAREVAVVRKVS